MEYRYLEAFRCVARRGSMLAAAEDLKIAPSAVSRQISLLEKAIGRLLFERAPRRVSLTPIGEALLREVSAFESAVGTVLGEDAAPKPLRIGTLQSVFETHLQRYLASASRDLRLECEVGAPEALLDKLRERKLDVVLSSHSVRAAGVDSVHLYDEVLCLASSGRVHPEPTKIVFHPYRELWSKVEERPERSILINSLNAAIELAKAGVGPTILPVSMAKRHRFERAKPLKGARMPIYFTTRKGSAAGAELKGMLRELRRLIRDEA